MNIIFSEFLLLEQIFFSPQVKQNVIIWNILGIYELLKDLRLWILGNSHL